MKNSSLCRVYTETKFNPSSSLMHGLNQPTTVISVPTNSQSTSAVKFSQFDRNTDNIQRPSSSTRPTVANSILKSSTTRWPPPYERDDHDDQYGLQTSSSASFVDDVRRMVRQFCICHRFPINDFFVSEQESSTNEYSRYWFKTESK